METKAITITRIDAELFKIQGNWAYWQNGNPIRGTYALTPAPNEYLSDVLAQKILRGRGQYTILVNCVRIVNEEACKAAKKLLVSESVTISL